MPVSFVSEHIETLEEIDMEYRELAHEHGITNWRRVPALNTDGRATHTVLHPVPSSDPSVPSSHLASYYSTIHQIVSSRK